MLQKAKDVIKDYNFKQNILYAASYLILGVLSASTVTIANSVYIAIFLL